MAANDDVNQPNQLIVVYLPASVYTLQHVMSIVRVSGYLFVCKRCRKRGEPEVMVPSQSIMSAKDSFQLNRQPSHVSNVEPIQVEIGDSHSGNSSSQLHQSNKDSLISKSAAEAQHK